MQQELEKEDGQMTGESENGDAKVAREVNLKNDAPKRLSRKTKNDPQMKKAELRKPYNDHNKKQRPKTC